jgi:uncharacterized protein YeaO (DUF488 family)
VKAINIKRVYEAPAAADGMRILVDRLWPRGLRKEDAALDLWCKELAPSPALRKWFDHRAERFAPFTTQYREELAGNAGVAGVLAQLGKSSATLLYAARDPALNHALVLAEFLRQARTATSGRS